VTGKICPQAKKSACAQAMAVTGKICAQAMAVTGKKNLAVHRQWL